MKKRYAIITDIHGNIEGLNAVLNDIKMKDVDDILCLGDVINIGPNSKECIDKLIELNIKTILGNHELYLLRGTDIEPTIEVEEKEHYKWVKESLTDKEINFIKSCPLYYEINIDYDEKKYNKKIVLCHYLINDEKLEQPFEKTHLKKDINLWIKYNNENITYIIGHLHKSFDINEVDGISGDYIEKTGNLTNIEIVDSAGCSYDDNVSYMIIEIDKSIKFTRVKVKFDRGKLVDKLNKVDFPDKKNIMKYFYGIETE
jgi:predicted phosphodiesterase